MKPGTAVIAGATGQIGRAVADYWLAHGWKLIGLSRQPAPDRRHPMLQVDLTDAADCRRKLQGLADVTHVVYAARYDHVGGQPESATINSVMLANVLDALEPHAAGLQHVHLVHGTKYYGHARVPSAEPFCEDRPRGEFENFYFSQQDFLEQRLRGSDCHWSVSRPHTFCDLAADESRSITLAVAVYAAILREMGLPLRYPGTPQSFAARTQFTWLPLLAEAIHWMCTTPACANQAFNLVNDDPMSWQALWSGIAAQRGMAAAEPVPIRLVEFMADKGDLWRQIVARERLRPSDLATVAQWAYADYVFALQWDVISDMGKARAFGFDNRVDTLGMWQKSLGFLAAQGRVPQAHCIAGAS